MVPLAFFNLRFSPLPQSIWMIPDAVPCFAEVIWYSVDLKQTSNFVLLYEAHIYKVPRVSMKSVTGPG